MNGSHLTLGRKGVIASQPYDPQVGRLGSFVGREAEMRLILAAWMGGRHTLPMAPLLIGEPGVGKNRLVYELALCTGRELYIFQGHEDVTAEDLACAVRFSDDHRAKMDYVASPLVTAMERGGICYIDEIGKIRPRALALLVSVLDERRYIDSTLLGERVVAKPTFRFIAATNTGEVNALPEFIRSRMRPVVKVSYPTKELVDAIIERQFPSLQQDLRALLDCFWGSWVERIGKDGRPPTPRDAIYVFGLATNLADFASLEPDKPIADSSSRHPFALETPARTGTVTAEHVKRAVDELFSRDTP